MGAKTAYYNKQEVNYQTCALWNIEDILLQKTTTRIFKTLNNNSIPSDNKIQGANGVSSSMYIVFWGSPMPTGVIGYEQHAVHTIYYMLTVQNDNTGFGVGWVVCLIYLIPAKTC